MASPQEKAEGSKMDREDCKGLGMVVGEGETTKDKEKKKIIQVRI